MRFVPKLWVDGYGGVGKVLVAPTASYTAAPCYMHGFSSRYHLDDRQNEH